MAKNKFRLRQRHLFFACLLALILVLRIQGYTDSVEYVLVDVEERIEQELVRDVRLLRRKERKTLRGAQRGWR